MKKLLDWNKKRFEEDLTLREMEKKVVELVHFFHVSTEGL
jgi:hypothetical protein